MDKNKILFSMKKIRQPSSIFHVECINMLYSTKISGNAFVGSLHSSNSMRRINYFLYKNRYLTNFFTKKILDLALIISQSSVCFFLSILVNRVYVCVSIYIYIYIYCIVHGLIPFFLHFSKCSSIEKNGLL